MHPHEPPSVSVCRRGSDEPGSDPLRIVVWVRGEQDLASRAHLSASIARAADLDDADVAVDLSGVTFMDASTIGALVLARNRLRTGSHSLSVRAPSPRARRLLDLCELAGMIDEPAAAPRRHAAPALDSWVAVPASGRAPTARSHEPARAPAPRPREAARSVGQRQAPA